MNHCYISLTIVSLDIAKTLKNDLAVATGKTTRQIILFEEEMAEIKETMIDEGKVVKTRI